MRTPLLPALLVLLASSAAAQESKVVLKDDPNRALVLQSCLMCHSVDYIPLNSPFQDRKGWEATVNKMINAMGAPIKKDDVPAIVDYLTRYYGRP
jgi:hypothetical protein